MISLGLRSVTATGLSLWIGVLACVLGCAKPSVASTSASETKASGFSAAPCPERGGEDEEPCCRHGHNPADGSGKNEQHSISCCPAETALIQKQNVAPPLLVHLYVAVLALPGFHTSNFCFCERYRGLFPSLARGARHSSSGARTPRLEIAGNPQRFFRADGFVRLPITLSSSKGEDYEDAKSDVVDGCDRAGSSWYSDGGAVWMLRFR